MPKKNTTMKLEKVVNFIAEYPEFLFIVANPASDEILGAYGGKASLMRFKDEHHIVLRTVSPDMFELAIDEFMSGLTDMLNLDIETPEHVQFIKAVGGSIKAVGKELLVNSKDDGKKSSKKGSPKGRSTSKTRD